MKKIKKIVDERQEMDLLRIEHVGFWVVFWGLFASIMIQSLLMDVPFAQFAPEWTIFMISCVVVMIGSVRKGVWSYYGEPTLRNYILASVLGSVGVGLIFAISKYMKYESLRGHILDRLLPITLIFVIPIFIIMLAGCALVGKMVRDRQKKMEKEYSDEE